MARKNHYFATEMKFIGGTISGLARVSSVILSDRDLRTEIQGGRIIIEPFDES